MGELANMRMNEMEERNETHNDDNQNSYPTYPLLSHLFVDWRYNTSVWNPLLSLLDWREGRCHSRSGSWEPVLVGRSFRTGCAYLWAREWENEKGREISDVHSSSLTCIRSHSREVWRKTHQWVTVTSSLNFALPKTRFSIQVAVFPSNRSAVSARQQSMISS